jgi:DNA-binding NarL/FixJ family response regulator
MHDTDNARDPIVLSEREWEIVQRVSLGESNAEIAHAMCISAATLHTHLAHVYKKLGLHGKEQLTDWHGLTQFEGAPPGQL